MPLQLTPRLEEQVEHILTNRHFANGDDVIAAALRLLDERERVHRLQETLIEAEEQTRRGEVVEWTPALRAQLWREAEELNVRGATAIGDDNQLAIISMI